MKITIDLRHGTMVPFTSQHFRQLRDSMIAAGFADTTHQTELEHGGPTFIEGRKLITLDAVTSYGLPYWRVRRHSLDNSTNGPL
jgi:hypothetical protein